MPTTDVLPSRTAHLPEWIPRSLSELHGPREGIVDLPLDLCWSGRTRYDLGSFRQRVALYNLVIVQALQEHYAKFLLGTSRLQTGEWALGSAGRFDR